MNLQLRDRFIEFARLKLALDGSDAYIMGAVEQARTRKEDPYWAAGVFTTFYAPPSHESFMNVWSMHDVLNFTDEVQAWTIANWEDLPVSGARHTNRMGPHKCVETLVGYAKWLTKAGPETLGGNDFPLVFKRFIKNVPNHGRYTGLKLYETLRRLGAPFPTVTDIRPSGGRVPRRALNMIYGHNHKLDDAEHLAEANQLAHALALEIPTTWFNVEMLLCNFTKAVKGSYYPGHALDRELERAVVCADFNPIATASLSRVRKKLYSDSCLGEFNGWSGVRKELGRCLPDHGYLWSDILYDYGATTDLAHPAPQRKWNPVVANRGYGEEEVGKFCP